MNKIRYIKEYYKPEDIQDALRSDGLILTGINITANFKNYNKRSMTKKEVDKVIGILYDTLIHENDLDVSRDYTS